MVIARFVAVLFLLGFSGSTLSEDLTAEKRADIEKLLQITGSAALGKQMAGTVVGYLAQKIKKMRPDIPQRVIDVLPGEVEAVFEANMASLTEQVIPLYHKYFTGSEIKEMLRFYSTDLGKKTISVMPALMGESMAIGQRWGEALGPTIDARVKARYMKEGYAL